MNSQNAGRLVSLLWSAVGCLVLTAADPVRVRIHWGTEARPFALADFAVPPSMTGQGHLEVAGVRYPVQMGAGGRATVLLSGLPTRGPVDGLLTHAEAVLPPTAQAVPRGNRLELRLAGELVAAYALGGGEAPRDGIPQKFLRGGYLHPLRTPGGRTVTDDYPANHLHHHGIWSPWTKTRFEGRAPDFWNMGDRTGREEFVALAESVSGPAYAGFRAEHRMVDMVAKPEKAALDESWEVRVFNLGEPLNRRFRLLEIRITQHCATASRLELPKYHYGGLGLRGNWAWNGAESARWLTSEGVADRVQANATRGRWCWLGGTLEEGVAGIAVLGAPDNFRAPQPMRVHPTEPFFCFAPSQLGDWAIEPGRPYVARYRLVIADGEPDRELIEQCWRDFAEPVRVDVLP